MSPRRVPLQLEAEDVKLAHYIAERRNVNESHFGAQTIRGQDSYDVHLQGAMAEVAFARYFGLDPDMKFASRGGGGRFDNYLGGKSVEVKACPYFGYLKWGLMVLEKVFKNADAYYLICVDTKTGYCELVGWATGREVGAKPPIRPDAKKPYTHVVPVSELRQVTRHTGGIVEVEVWTDGSTVKNPGPGGWAAVMRAGGRQKVITGFDPDTTNNRMEMMAALEALRLFKKRSRFTIYSDSQYLVNAFRENWIDKWAENNYMRRARKPFKSQRGGAAAKVEAIPNRDLWMSLDARCQFHDVEWVWVRGHDNDEMNEMAHDAAYKAAQEGYAAHLANQGVLTLPQNTTVEARLAEIELRYLPEGGDTPRTELAILRDESGIKISSKAPDPVPSPPDPPPFEAYIYWAVWKRVATREVYMCPEVRPISPSEYEDRGRAFCMETAHKMNTGVDPLYAKFGNRGVFVAAPNWMIGPGGTIKEVHDWELKEIMEEARDGARKLRAV